MSELALGSCLSCWRFEVFDKNKEWGFGGCNGNGMQCKSAATQPFKECWEGMDERIKFLRANGWTREADLELGIRA